MAEFGNPEVIEEEVDILIIGGGMGACGCHDDWTLAGCSEKEWTLR